MLVSAPPREAEWYRVTAIWRRLQARGACCAPPRVVEDVLQQRPAVQLSCERWADEAAATAHTRGAVAATLERAATGTLSTSGCAGASSQPGGTPHCCTSVGTTVWCRPTPRCSSGRSKGSELGNRQLDWRGRIEWYLIDPTDEPDASLWQTELAYLLTDENPDS